MGTFYKYWYIFLTIIRITSAYNYCFYAAYRRPTYDLISGNIYELFFLLDFVINLFLDFKPNPASPKSIKVFTKTSVHYMKGTFIYDLIPLIPLQLLKLDNRA